MKPADISLEAWDAAHKAWCDSQPSVEDEILATFARAIDDAVKRERMGCIGTVLGFIEYGGDTYHGITMNPMADAQKIAAAIRARGEG